MWSVVFYPMFTQYPMFCNITVSDASHQRDGDVDIGLVPEDNQAKDEWQALESLISNQRQSSHSAVSNLI